MSRDLAEYPAPTRLALGLARLFGRLSRDKQALSACNDRMAVLDDPATRRALANLDAHTLRDIGVVDLRRQDAPVSVDGESLRRHLW